MPVIDDLKNQLRNVNSFKNLGVENIVRFSEKIGNELQQKNLKTNQIRKILDAVRKIENQVKKSKTFSRDQLILLKPIISYASKRIDETDFRNMPGKVFGDALLLVIDKVQDKEDFTLFVKYTESIVAYHKYFGGKD